MREFSSFNEMVRDVSEGYETGGKTPNTDLLDQAQRAANRGDGITTLMLVMAHQFSGSTEDRKKALNAVATYQKVEAQKVYDQAIKATESITSSITNEQIGLLVEATGRLNLAYILELFGESSAPQG